MKKIRRKGIIGRVKSVVDFHKRSAKYNGELKLMGDLLIGMSTEVIGEIDGIQIIRNDKIMKIKGALVAVAVFLDDGSKAILTDDLYDELDEKTKEFVLYHELGHFMDKNLDLDKDIDEKNKERIAYAKRGEVHPEELFADNYALSKLGYYQSVNSLRNLQSVVNNFRLFTCDKEFILRIKHMVTEETMREAREMKDQGNMDNTCMA